MTSRSKTGRPYVLRNPETTQTGRIMSIFEERPGVPMTVTELVEWTGLEKKQVSSNMTRLVGGGVLERVAVSTWVYDPATAGTRRGPKTGDTPADLRPITDQLDDDVFKAAGLQPVARTADGDRICVDDQGTAWRVRVTVQARLI